MALESGAFVRKVMAELGVSSPSELAEAMRWKRGAERLVSKWLSGVTKPGYSYTMEMLEKTGWLAIKPSDEGARPLSKDDLAKIRLLHEQFQEDARRVLEDSGE